MVHRRVVGFLVVFSLFLSLPLFATTRSWTGAASANWSAPANWSPAGVPQPSDALMFQAGAANRDMINDLPAATPVGSMTFIGDPYTLSGNLLTLNGDVSACTCNVDLKLGAAVTFSGVRTTGAVDINGQTLTASATEINGGLNGTGVVIVRGVFSSGLTVNGAGNFSGTIQDDAAGGTLQLAGSCSLPNATVALQAIMQLGTVATLGDVTITPSSSGVVTPGPGGILHTKSLAVQGGGVVAFVGAGASSLIDVNGTVTLTGARLLLGGAGLLPGQSVTIIKNDGADPVRGTFLNLPEGATVIGSPGCFISYTGGDGNDVVLTSPAGRFITNTIVTQGTSSTPFGVPVTLTASVSAQPGFLTGPVGTLTGSVTFVVDGVSAGSSGLLNGVATWIVTNLSVGDHTIAASFHGAGAFDSTSATISHAVSRGQTKTEVVAAQSRTIFGQPAQFTITVDALAPSSGQPAGSVTIFADGVPLGIVPVVNGTAAFQTSALHAGGKSITATYAGDANFAASTSSAIQENVGKAQTEVDARSRTLLVGESPLITVFVNPTSGTSLPPTGSVTLSENGSVAGAQALAGGAATFSLTPLPVGDHTFVVNYSGDTDFEASSATLAQSVVAPSVSIHGTRVNEGNFGVTTVSLVITLSAAVSTPVRVSFSTLAGTATEGEDYEKASGVIEFAPGEVTRSIELHIFGDTLPELDETFSVLLSDAVNATIETPSAIVVIVNDDQAPPRRRPSRH